MSAALVACALRKGSLIQRALEHATLRFFGKYSYGLYVFHYSLDATLTASLRIFFRNHLHSKGLAVIVAALVVACATIVVSLLSYHLYEVHFLKLKKYFGYNRASRKAQVAPAEQTA